MLLPHDQRLASGMLNTSQQVGFTVGIAALVSVAASAHASSTAHPPQTPTDRSTEPAISR